MRQSELAVVDVWEDGQHWTYRRCEEDEYSKKDSIGQHVIAHPSIFSRRAWPSGGFDWKTLARRRQGRSKYDDDPGFAGHR